MLTDDGDGDGDGEGEADASCEECEVTDECAMLLNPTTAITPNTLRKVLKTPSHKYGITKKNLEAGHAFQGVSVEDQTISRNLLLYTSWI